MIQPTTIVYVTPKSPDPSLTPYRSLIRVTQPAIEPVSLSEAKFHSRVDTDDEDAYFATLIAVAREYVEERLDTTLLTTTWEASYDSFPMWELTLPRAPMSASSVSVFYRDEGGQTRTITSAAGDFQADHRTIPGRIYPNYSATWPAVRGDENSVIVRYEAGYGSDGSSVPAVIKHAILLLVAHWHETRQPVTAGSVAQNIQVPLTFETLIANASHGVYR